MLKQKDPRYKKFVLIAQHEKEEKRRKIEEEKEQKRIIETERLRLHRIEIAKMYQEQEDEAIANGDYDEVFVEEFRCDICKKVFKKEA